jgi:hypothetical protein
MGTAFYPTLQSAYNAAGNGDTVKCRALTFIENPTINRNITVALEGGYDCDYTRNTQRTTKIKGMVTTTVGGGKLTIKNFVLRGATPIQTTAPSGPVSIGGTSYASLQAAYNAAVSGDIIKCRDMVFTENLSINRDILVTLEGGWDVGFTENLGGQTTIHGAVTTTVGGGKLTIKNFIIEK